MTSVLLSTHAIASHINQYVGLFRCLRAAGHQVKWVSPTLEFIDRTPQHDLLEIEALAPRRTMPTTVGTGGVDARTAEYRAVLIDHAHARVDAMREAIRRVRADVVVSATRTYAAVIAAHLEGVPYACISTGFSLAGPAALRSHLSDYEANLRPELERLCERHQLEPRFKNFEIISPHANAVFSTERFLRGAELPPCTHLIGPACAAERGDEPDFPWNRLDPARPLVYICFGHLNYDHPELFRLAIECARELGAQVVVALIGLIDSDFARSLPADVIAVRYAPQLALLERASLFVSQCGDTSVTEAMFAGVPVLGLPMTSGQPITAYFVRESGVGITLDPEQVSREAVVRAMTTLLAEDDGYRRAAHEVRASYRARDGGQLGAKLVLELA